MSRTNLILAIDTNAYSGNFERNLIGYAMGQYDEERYHGAEEVEEFADWAAEAGLDPQMFESVVTTHRHDEYGHITATILPTPGRLNNGMGFHYDAGDNALVEEARQRSIASMREYQKGQREMIARRFAENDFEPDDRPGGWTREACERTIQNLDATLRRAGEFNGYPAYESVGVHLTRELTDDELKIVKSRCEEFAKREGFEIRGYRLIKEVTKTNSEDLTL